MDWIEIILGGIVGVFCTEVYEKVLIKQYKITVKKRIQKKRMNLYNNQNITNFIMDYYTRNASYDDLYDCKIGNYSRKILFLTNVNFYNQDIDIYRNPDIISLVDGSPCNFHVNKRMIKKRKDIGQQLFDGDAIYLNRIVQNRIESKKCTFFEKLSLIDQVEKETYRCAMYKIFKKTPMRNRTLKSFADAISTNMYPVSLGCHVVFSMKMNNKKYVALHKRSHQTFTYGGYYATIPVFGIVPIPDHSPNGITNVYENNILFYNIIKEYCEELHNEEVLQNKETHSNPFWFYQSMSVARELILSLEDNTSKCTYLGYGFDAVNGLSILAALLYISDEQLSQKIYNAIIANWEVENEVIFYEISDPHLSSFLSDNCLQNGTAFALSQALDKLKILP